MTDRKTIDVYDARAAEYADVTSGISKDPRLIDFIARLPNEAAVLDLGCGPGSAAAAMAAHGHHVTAWDASSEMVALARAKPGVSAAQHMFDDLPSLPPASLNGVWANFSLLHAPRADMPRHLEAIAGALASSGHFLIAVKSGTGAHRDSIGRLYTYYTDPELSALLEAAGFDILRRDQGRDTGLSGEDADWISFTCQKTT